MGFWPFGASKRNRRRALTDQADTTLLEKSEPASMTRTSGTTVQQGNAQTINTESRQPQNEEKARKLSKIRPSSQKNSSYNLPQTYGTPPQVGSLHTGIPRRASYLGQNMSQTSIGPDNFTATPQVPTLYARRPDYDPNVLRKKSSKRKADDHARERELRAMTAPMPIPKPRRPATYSGSGPLQRETISVPGDLGRPSSQVSLPIPENISEVDDSAYQNSFKIGIFAALSPRPTVRYDGRNRGSMGKQPARLQPVYQSIEEEDLTFSKRRIDDLADNLDSTALRELMDRDQKRRLKKKKTDEQKLQRKLQHRADKDQEENTRRVRAAEFARTSSANLQDQQQVDATEQPTVTTAEPMDPDNPFSDPRSGPGPATVIRNPFEDEKDIDVMQETSDREDETAPPIPVQSPQRKAATVRHDGNTKPLQGAISPPSSPIDASAGDANVSQLSFKNEPVQPKVVAGLERDRRPSEQGGPTGSLWTTFFRRGTRRSDGGGERGKQTPSEFSNTSRESFAGRKPPQLNTSQRTFRRKESTTPQRTMSRFREDLPELPLSPPDSRVQSPEAQPAQPIDIRGRALSHARSGQIDGRSLATSSSIPTLDRGRGDSRVQSLVGDEAPGHALSQSLASVDSEASWLSGKPVKRFSGPLNARHIETKPDEMEEVLAEDEYLNRLSPEPHERRQSALSSGRRPSSTLLDLKAEQQSRPIGTATETGETWHAGVARQPTVVKAATRAKSREGLLKDFQADIETISSDEGDDDDESPKVEDVQLMRARSVDYGKGHARKISAGSAKVLDIRRSSAQFATPPLSPAMRTTFLAGQEKKAD